MLFTFMILLFLYIWQLAFARILFPCSSVYHFTPRRRRLAMLVRGVPVR